MPTYRFRLDGKNVSVHSEAEMPLLHALRNDLRLHPQFGCSVNHCGACTVHLDGEPVRSCVTPVSEVAGRTVMTRRAEEARPKPHPLQAALRRA